MPDATQSGETGKANDRHPVVNAVEKSDALVVPKKLRNKAGAAEAMEERGATKGNAARRGRGLRQGSTY